MLVVMRFDSSNPKHPCVARLGNGAGVWVLALVAGVAAPSARVPCQTSPRPFIEAPAHQQAQTRIQTPGETQNPVDKPAPGNQQGQTNTGSEQPTSGAEQPDETLAGIRAALEKVSSPDLGELGRAFNTPVKKQDEASSKSSTLELIELGDLDGDGVSEVVAKVPGIGERQSDVQSPDSSSSWLGLYLLCWDGAHWKASSLGASGQHSEFKVIRLGKGVGRGIAVVNVIGEDRLPYPAIFEVREHAADLLWDSQVGDNRFNPLQHGHIEFQDDPKLDETEMIETGRADPGLLEFQPGGRRGFNARSVYHWDGESYIPVRTEYSPGPDHNLYGFIAALHLHDFRSAYALIDPGEFLKTDKPSLEQFRQVMETNWQEFLDDQVFQAREAKAGSPNAYAFELPEKHYVYLPTLSNDGKFLLTGLERKIEEPSTEPGEDSP